jgi:glycerate kinase
MARRVLIVPDKFKGTLTAQAAAQAIAAGWRAARPEDELELLPMSDGGDGFGEVLASALQLVPQTCETLDAAHRPRRATWWLAPKGRTAIIESAQVIGLAVLPPKQFHPFELDTRGLGAVLRKAVESGASQCLIGIGGSATNDGGFGMALALGWEFSDAKGAMITRWTELSRLAHIRRPATKLDLGEPIVAVDVQNPLLGPAGASRVYGPQKGLRAEDFALTEECLGQMAVVATRDLGLDCANEPGAGAAGGLGFGLRCFLEARLEPGFALFARHTRLEERVRESELVITGEGAIDRSTLMGKGVGELARMCGTCRVPCLGLSGAALPPEVQQSQCEPFSAIFTIVPELASAQDSQAQPRLWLERLAEKVARQWKE